MEKGIMIDENLAEHVANVIKLQDRIAELEAENAAMREIDQRMAMSQMKLQEENAELRGEVAEYQKNDSERAELLAAIRADAKTAIRKALGAALWNQFWGPELERLVGVVYEVWMERSKMETEVEALRAYKEALLVEFEVALARVSGWTLAHACKDMDLGLTIGAMRSAIDTARK